jgi:pyruvate/oxaloacetate carboxyltransferase
MNIESAIGVLRANGYTVEWSTDGGVESIAVKSPANPKLSPAAAGHILKEIKEMKPAALDFLRTEAAPKLMCALAAHDAGTALLDEHAEVLAIAQLNLALGRPMTTDGTPWLEVIRGYEDAVALATALQKAA